MTVFRRKPDSKEFGMSTEYYTDTPYEKMIQAKSVRVTDSEAKIYNVPHKVLYKNGSQIWIRLGTDGNAVLQRFGMNKISKIFPHIIQEFGCKITDEYGLEYPDCIS
jgi:hypothetical protein